MKSPLFSVSTLLSVFLLCACGKPTDEDAIRKSLAEFHQSFDNKDLEKYMAYFSPEYPKAIADYESMSVEQWKEGFNRKYFRPYRKLSTTYRILSVEKLPSQYWVMEEQTTVGVDSLGKDTVLWKDRALRVTFVKLGERWYIDRIHSPRVPASYGTLSDQYQNPGAPGLLYVSHISLQYVSVIDTRTNTVIGIIHSAYGPTSVAMAGQHKLGYITDYVSDQVTVYNIGSNGHVADIVVGKHPTDILVDPAEDYVFVSHESNDGLWVISRRTNEVLEKLPGRTGPLVWSATQRRIYQPQIFRPFIYIINPKPNYSYDQIEVGGRPLGLALTPDERYAYVTNYDLNEVEKIETSSKRVEKRISGVSHPRGIAIHPNGVFAYVTGVRTNKLYVLELRRDTVVDSITIGKMPTDIAINPVNHCAYIANQAGGMISVLDMKTNRIADSIQVADNPISVRIDFGPVLRATTLQKK